MNLPEICQLKSVDLVKNYRQVILHYAFNCAPEEDISKFGEIALREEILRRCHKYEDWLESDREDLAKGITHRAI